MKRTNKTGEGEVLLWKKINGGSLYMGRKIIKPGQVFKARLEDIPKAFRDIIVPADSEKAAKVTEIEAAKATKPVATDVDAPEYFVKQRSVGYYDVVDGEGKVQNEKALRQKAAEELVENLKNDGLGDS